MKETAFKLIGLNRIRKNDGSNFYTFISESLSYIDEICKHINEDELIKALNNNHLFFKGPYSKKKFCFLIKHINEKLLEILHLCYQGDIISASNYLCKLLMYKDSAIKRNLNEYYINFFEYKFSKTPLYRMRDEKKGANVDNCWHIPYSLRHKTSLTRFSMAGIPSLYLADSLETANLELGNIDKNYDRWVSEFCIKDEKPFLDLSIPSKQNIEEMDDYSILSFIITFPIRFICSIKTLHINEKFHEEYFLSQLIYHTLFFGNHVNVLGNFVGIYYSSTKNPNGKCFVMPTKYNFPNEIYDKKLLNIFEISNPHKL